MTIQRHFAVMYRVEQWQCRCLEMNLHKSIQMPRKCCNSSVVIRIGHFYKYFYLGRVGFESPEVILSWSGQHQEKLIWLSLRPWCLMRPNTSLNLWLGPSKSDGHTIRSSWIFLILSILSTTWPISIWNILACTMCTVGQANKSITTKLVK